MIAYLDLPPAIDFMLDALLSTGLYGEDRNAALCNLVLDQVKHLAGARGPLAELLLEANRRARQAAEYPPPPPVPYPGPTGGALRDDDDEMPF